MRRSFPFGHILPASPLHDMPPTLHQRSNCTRPCTVPLAPRLWHQKPPPPRLHRALGPCCMHCRTSVPQTLLPRNVVKKLWEEHEVYVKRARKLDSAWIELGTPAATMLEVATGLLAGDLPSMQDVLLVRTAILHAWDLYTPVGGWLKDQMAGDMDVSCDCHLFPAIFLLCFFDSKSAAGCAVTACPHSTCFASGTGAAQQCQ